MYVLWKGCEGGRLESNIGEEGWASTNGMLDGRLNRIRSLWVRLVLLRKLALTLPWHRGRFWEYCLAVKRIGSWSRSRRGSRAQGRL